MRLRLVPLISVTLALATVWSLSLRGQTDHGYPQPPNRALSRVRAPAPAQLAHFASLSLRPDQARKRCQLGGRTRGN